MATVKKEPYPLIPGVDPNLYYRYPHNVQDDALDEIDETKIIRFRVGDGYALYYVEDAQKGILQHIPYGDAWEADPDLINGLTPRRIKELLQAESFLRNLFSPVKHNSDGQKKKDKKKS